MRIERVINHLFDRVLKSSMMNHRDFMSVHVVLSCLAKNSTIRSTCGWPTGASASGEAKNGILRDVNVTVNALG